MKKAIFVGVLLIFCVSFIAAQGIDLGNFPVGIWHDAKWNVNWEFTSGNIRILYGDGSVAYDFAGKIEDFQFKLTGTVPAITFKCSAAGRSYKFSIEKVTSTDITMDIVRDNGDTYKGVMKKQ